MAEASDLLSPEQVKCPIDVDPRGDLLLRIKDHGTGTDCAYRVSTTVLRRASPYFRVLLDPSKFSEGIAVDKRLRAIRGLQEEIEAIPSLELPMIFIPDIGHVPKTVSTESAVLLFLHVLHNEDTSWPTPKPSFLALLAIIADRFAATTPIANYVIQRKWKTKIVAQKGPNSAAEVRLRQQLLIGLILRFPDWVRQCSASLIVQGSERWSTLCEEVKEGEALWWNLPNGLEGMPKAE